MLIVAHRGGSPDDIENSATAFDHGIALGADLLECDLQLSASEEIVLYHDCEIFGTPVRQFTTDELRALIPSLLTFDQFLERFADAGTTTRFVLDLKTCEVHRALVRYLADPELRSRALVTSTYSWGLWRLRRRFPDLRLGLSRGATFTRVPPRLMQLTAATVGNGMALIALIQMVAFRIDTAAFQHWLLTPFVVGALRAQKRRLYAWTVDDPDRTAELQAIGIDYLTTNTPATIIPSVGAGER